MNCSENVSGTLRAQEHGHQPLVYENHGIDSRYTGPHKVAPTMSARYGTGGNNVPLVEQEADAICIAGNTVDRQPQNGGNGLGCQDELAYTLTATDRHCIYTRQRVDVFKDGEVVSTQSARQHKDATDLLSWMWQDLTAAMLSRMGIYAGLSRKELPAVPSTPFIRSATDCLSVVLLRWSVKDCRASRTAGRIYPVLRTVPVIKRWATVWRYPAWSLSCRGSPPRFYEAQR